MEQELHRLATIGGLPEGAKIGLVDITQCGAGYMSRLGPDDFGQDRKVRFLRTCTEFGYPRTFHDEFQHRLEQRLGKKLARIATDRPFMAKAVAGEAEKLGLDFAVAGDLLAMGETGNEAVVAAQLFVVRVVDGKVVVQGVVKKNGPRGTLPKVVDAVADLLYDRSFVD